MKKAPPYGALYATSPFGRAVLTDDTLREAGVKIHAKAMGTSVTLCGEPTLTWVKLFDLPFSEVLASKCEGCMDVIVLQ